MKKVSRLFLHAVQIILLILSIWGGSMGFNRIKQNTDALMVDLKSRVIVSIEDLLGYQIGYEEISPSFLSFLEIRNLTLTHPETREEILQIRNLKLFYNPLSYFFKRSGNVLISNINITGLKISFDLERDRSLLGLFSSSDRDNQPTVPLDLSRYYSGRIRIRSWSLHYGSSEDSVKFEGNTITLKQQDDYMRIKLNGHFSLIRSVSDLPLDRIVFDVSVTGNLQNNLGGFNLNGDFRDVQSNLFDIPRQELNIRFDGNEFKLAKVRDRQPYDLNLVFQDNWLTVDFNADQFSPGKIVTLKGKLENIDPWLSTVLSGTGHFEIFLDEGSMLYSYDGTAFVDNQNLPFPVNAEIRASGSESILLADQLTVSTVYGTYAFSGEWAFPDKIPQGELSFFQMPVSEDITMEGNLIFEEVEDYFYIRSENLELSSGWHPGNLKILISRNEDSFVYSLRSELNPANSYKDQILLNGEFSFDETFRLKSSYVINQFSMETLKAFLPSYEEVLSNPLLGSMVLQTNGSFTVDGGDYYIRMQDFGISSPDGKKDLKCRGFISPDEFEVYSLEMNWDDNYLLGSFQGRLAQDEINLESSWNLNNNTYLVNSVYSDGKLSFIGNYGLKGQVYKDPASGFLATVEAGNYPLTWNGQKLLSSFNVRGRYRDDDWELYLKESEFLWDSTDILSNPALALTAYLAPGSVNIFSMEYRDDFSVLKGSGSLFYDLNQNIFNGSINLNEGKSDSTNETYSVYCVYNDGILSSTMQIQNALLDRFVQFGLKGAVDADVTIDGSLTTPVIEGNLASSNFEYGSDKMAFNGRFQLNRERVELYDLNVVRNNVTLSRGLGFFNFREGNLMLTTRVSTDSEREEGGSRKLPVETGMTIMIDMQGAVEFSQLNSMAERDFSGRFRTHPIQWNGMITYPARVIEFERKGSELSGSLLSDPSQNFRYNLSNKNIEIEIGDSFPVSFSMKGNFDPEQLDMDFSNVRVNLNTINYFIPKDRALNGRYVVFRENSAMEGAVHIGGTLANPDFQGELDSRRLLVLTPYVNDEIAETNIRLSMNGNRIETNRFIIPIGEGQLVGEGYLNLSGWGIGDYSLTVKAEGKPGTPFDYNAYGVQASGAFTGDVRLFGTNQQGGLEGTLVFNELLGSMGERTELVSNDGSSVKYPFTLDLKFITGRNAKFILPNPQLAIATATAEQGEQVNLTLDTLNDTFSLTGAVNIRNGEINYFDRSFELTEGSITFNENEDLFNPFVNMEAEIETTDIDGDDVTVYLTYRNAVLEEFTPIMRSDPPRTDEQIMALFGQSLIPYDTEEVDLSKLVLATGGMVSDYALVEPFESALKDSLNLDSVTIKTEILENALLNQLEGSTYTGSDSYNLGQYLDNTSIHIGRFIGDYLFFSAGILVDYDELNGINSYTGGMTFVPDLTLEMRTPVFSGCVELQSGKILHDIDNTDFVPRNSISLEWQFSY